MLTARIVDGDSAPITPDAVSSIRYSVFEISARNPDDLAIVAGHDDAVLDPADVLLDGLQTDAAWSLDATGFNFRHELAAVGAESFPRAGARYQVRYELTAASGRKLVFRFQFRSA